ncbi:7-cyano-7-deazaguanine synthase QueC [Candidatus Pacearchaeota archaeon]|nr:7-cyano-7-deazaguanine synthase QueC [Candidatus Pacearchaeota archaeon]
MKRALVLCSGGIDSVVTAWYVAKHLKYKPILLFFNYGQHACKQERRCVKVCAQMLHAPMKEITLNNLKELNQSSLTRQVKPENTSSLKNTKDESKNWYVPQRNLIFLSYALAYAESLCIQKKPVHSIFIGFKCEGEEHFPDTTPEFLKQVNQLAKVSASVSIKIHAPLIKKDKEDIILLGEKLGVDLNNTWSCYLGGKKPCNSCLACRLRSAGFYWADRTETS